MSFLRSGPPGGDGGDHFPPAKPKLSAIEPEAPQPENLLARPRGDESPPAPRVFERDPRTEPTPPERCTNVIAAGSRWKGTLSINDSVRIDGHMTGEIDAKGTVHISEGANLEAKVKAAFVVVSGAFKGEIRALERLELLPRSKVQGELITKVLNVHEGAIVDGSIRMSSDKGEDATKAEGERSEAANGSRSARGA
jgi:cytoskeletal protein CcmA (bactofilin family)